MLKYEILSILRNKISYMFVLILLIFGLKITVDLENTVAAYHDTENIKRELQYEIVMQKQLWETEIISARVRSESIEKIKYSSNLAKYRKWKIDTMQELIDLLEADGQESERFQEKAKSYNLINNLASQQIFIYAERGCEPVEVRFQEELAGLNEELGWEELPFDISALAGNPYASYNILEASVASYENNMKLLEYQFIDYDKKSLGFENGSPYTFLECLLSDDYHIPIIIDVCILLFSFGYVLEGKSRKQHYFMDVQPKSEWKKYGHYVGASFAAAGILCALGIGVWFLYWGIRYGFEGLTSHMFVDIETYRGLHAYEHLEDYSYVGISRMYADYKYTDGGQGVLLLTRYPLGFVPLYEFLLRLGILALLKVLFLNSLGTGIAILAQNQQKAIGGMVAVTAALGYSQISRFGKPYNPFAVASCWDVTLGGEGITWLAALLDMVLLNIIIAVGVCVIAKYKDKA